MREFIVASEQAVEEEETGEEKVVEFSFTIDGKRQSFQATKPSPGMVNVLFAARGGGEGTRTTWRFLRKVLKGDGYARLVDLVADGKIPVDLLFGGDADNDQGIVDYIVTEFAGQRPTEPSSDSSPSPNSDGSKSRGRSPGKGSIGASSS
jgi:hypothetical protein